MPLAMEHRCLFPPASEGRDARMEYTIFSLRHVVEGSSGLNGINGPHSAGRMLGCCTMHVRKGETTLTGQEGALDSTQITAGLCSRERVGFAPSPTNLGSRRDRDMPRPG